MKRLVLTDQAEADLEAIGDNIALDNRFVPRHSCRNYAVIARNYPPCRKVPVF